MANRRRIGSKRKVEANADASPPSTSTKRPRVRASRTTPRSGRCTSSPGVSATASTSASASAPASAPALRRSSRLSPTESSTPNLPPRRNLRDRRRDSNEAMPDAPSSPLPPPPTGPDEASGVVPAGQPGQETLEENDTRYSDDGDDFNEVHEFDDMDEDDEEGEDDYYDEDGLAINLGSISGFFCDFNDRFSTLLAGVKKHMDPAEQLSALEELAGLLSISQEDSLMGLPTSAFIREFIRILGGNPVSTSGNDSEAEDEPKEEDSETAVVLNAVDDGTKAERQVLACRCIANLIEAMPQASRVVVNLGGVGALVLKLVDIELIDLAEQVLQTLEKISLDHPAPIVKEGGLMAMLQYIDFFNIHVQRTALTTVANCCRKLQEQDSGLVLPAIPILARAVGNPDRRLQESACSSVVRIIESYHKFPALLAQLVTAELCLELEKVLVPPSKPEYEGADVPKAAPVATIPNAMATDIVRALSLAAKASPLVAHHLLLSDVNQTLYAILTGSRAPSTGTDNSTAQHRPLDKMTLLQNLSARPKEQIQEALSLTMQLLPSPPRVGVFDFKNYTEQALKRAHNEAPKKVSSIRAGGHKYSTSKDLQAIKAASAQLDAEEQVPVLRLCQLVLPALVEIHTASVTPSVRQEAIGAILQILAWGNSEQLGELLAPVPMSTFLAGVLSSNDGPGIVLGSLQIVELLMVKVGEVYRRLLQREGVLWEIQQLAAKDLSGELGASPIDKRKSDISSRSNTGRRSSSGRRASSQLTAAQQTDLNILRARMIKLLYMPSGSGSEEEVDRILQRAKMLAKRLRTTALVSSDTAREVLDDVLAALSSKSEGLAGWELLQSGLVDALLVFVSPTSQDDALSLDVRRDMLYHALAENPSSAVLLVQRLQEDVSRVQNVDLVNMGDALDEEARRSPGLALTSQMRLNLVPTEPEQFPRPCRSLVIGIHAVAPLATVNEFLRSKIQVAESVAEMDSSSGSGSDSRHSRLSSILAALSAAAEGHSSDRPADRTEETPRLDHDRENTTGPGSGSASGLVSRSSALQEREVHRDAATRALMQGLVRGAFDDVVVGDDLLEDAMDREDHEEGEGLWLEHDPAHEDETNEIPPDSPDSSCKARAQTTASDSSIDGQGTSSAADNPPRDTGNSERSSESRRTTSYADALQRSLSSDKWHLAFRVGDRDVQLDETVFGAVYRMHKDKDPSWKPDRSFWTTPFTVTFRKVKGIAPCSDTAVISTYASREDERPESPLNPDMSQALKLLHVLYHTLSPRNPTAQDIQKLTSLFINNKLTAKLNRQLEEPLMAASQVLPRWAEELPRQYPFLFPFATRFALLQSTAFGSTRLVIRWQSLLRSASGDNSLASRTREEAFGYLGRLSRQKVRIGRTKLLDSVVKICESYATPSSLLEVEYFDEVGTGLGPTLEFYSLASRAFAQKDTGMWLGSGGAKDVPREGESGEAEYLSAPQGLFPSPLRSGEEAAPAGRRRVELFRTLGTFVAKSLLDSRIIHVDLNPVFWALVLERDVPKSVQTIGQIDETLAASLKRIQALPCGEVESIGLDFTLPGDDAFELVEDGKNKIVTGSNLDKYVGLIADVLVGHGTSPLVMAFRQGIKKLMDPRALSSFMPNELVEVFGNAPEDWTKVTLSSHIKPDHGFTSESEAYQNLLDLMASFDLQERRVFLQWLTGSPKLPIGGFKALQPPLTVVKRPHEAPLAPDDFLPSVMTCVNYLKLPNYSSANVLAQRVRKAMHEGSASFHLS